MSLFLAQNRTSATKFEGQVTWIADGPVEQFRGIQETPIFKAFSVTPICDYAKNLSEKRVIMPDKVVCNDKFDRWVCGNARCCDGAILLPGCVLAKGFRLVRVPWSFAMFQITRSLQECRHVF